MFSTKAVYTIRCKSCGYVDMIRTTEYKTEDSLQEIGGCLCLFKEIELVNVKFLKKTQWDELSKVEKEDIMQSMEAYK